MSDNTDTEDPSLQDGIEAAQQAVVAMAGKLLAASDPLAFWTAYAATTAELMSDHIGQDVAHSVFTHATAHIAPTRN